MLALTLPRAPFTFTFSYPSPLSKPLAFSLPLLLSSSSSTPHSPSLKRSRPLADIDDTPSPTPSCNTHGRKKRRLRLSLVTSRLSRPFSKPATYIVDRGNCKVAVWARQRCLTRVWLRKRAILNSVRRGSSSSSSSCGGGRGYMGVDGDTICPGNGSFGHNCNTNDLSCSSSLSSPNHSSSSSSTLPPTNARARFSALQHETPLTLSSPNTQHARRHSFEEDLAPHLAPLPPPSSSSFSHNRYQTSSTSASAPSPLGLSNYDALDDDDAYSVYSEQAVSEEDPEEWGYTPHPDLVDSPAVSKGIGNGVAVEEQPQQHLLQQRTGDCPLGTSQSSPAGTGPPSPCPSSASVESLTSGNNSSGAGAALPSSGPSLSPLSGYAAQASQRGRGAGGAEPVLPPSPSPSPSPPPVVHLDSPGELRLGDGEDEAHGLDLDALDISSLSDSSASVGSNANTAASATVDVVSPPVVRDGTELLSLEPPEEEMFDLVKRRFGGQRFLGLWVSG